MKTAILIINWNDYENTQECLNTLINNNPDQDYSIILIDNNSSDNSLKQLVSEFKLDVFSPINTDCEKYSVLDSDKGFENYNGGNLCILLKDNFGFTGANNFGMKFAYQNNFDDIMWLNNDTIVPKDFIKTSKRNLNLFPNNLNTCATVFYPDIENVRFYGGYLNRFGKPKSFYYNKNISNIPKENRYFSSILGAGCYIHYTMLTLEKLGGQDNDYFFNLDDADYSYYAHSLGCGTIVDTWTVLYHKSARSVFNRPGLAMYYYLRNLFYFRKKYFSLKKNILIYIYLILHGLGVLIIFTLKGKKPYYALKYTIIDILNGKMGKYKGNNLY